MLIALCSNLFLQYYTYVCTTDAFRSGICDASELGRFIIDLPQGKTINDTSIWSASVGFGTNITSGLGEISDGLWSGGSAGLPSLPDSPPNSTTNWRSARTTHFIDTRQQGSANIPTVVYKEPIYYRVPKKGYYCVGEQVIRIVKEIGSIRM
jgi:hypothetical protein